METSEKTRVTRRVAREMQEAAAASSSHGASSSTSLSGSVHGCFHCICKSFFMSHADDMLECVKCKNWSHAVCMEVDPTRLPSVRRSFVCMHCTGEAAVRRKRASSSSNAAARGEVRADEPAKVVLQKLTEVPDRTPTNVGALRSALQRLVSCAGDGGFDLIFAAIDAQPISDAMAEQALACCTSAIQSATFSESYPAWCLNELRSPPHKYLQGTFMRCRATHRIVSLVLSNGQDVYGSLRSTITQIRICKSRAAAIAAAGGVAPDPLPPFMEACLNITDVSPFVHLNLIATHPSYRGRGLAKMVIAAELLRWAMRGRRQVYLNMALDKALDGRRVVCSISPASKRLYDLFGFRTVFQRRRLRGGGGVDGEAVGAAAASSVTAPNSGNARRNKETGASRNASKGAEAKVVVADDDADEEEERFTPKEADMGRVLANLDYVDTVLGAVEALVASAGASRGQHAHADEATAAAPTSTSEATASKTTTAVKAPSSTVGPTETSAAPAPAPSTTRRKRNGTS